MPQIILRAGFVCANDFPNVVAAEVTCDSRVVALQAFIHVGSHMAAKPNVDGVRKPLFFAVDHFARNPLLTSFFVQILSRESA